MQTSLWRPFRLPYKDQSNIGKITVYVLGKDEWIGMNSAFKELKICGDSDILTKNDNKVGHDVTRWTVEYLTISLRMLQREPHNILLHLK